LAQTRRTGVAVCHIFGLVGLCLVD
jgi:hypothetical protein